MFALITALAIVVTGLGTVHILLSYEPWRREQEEHMRRQHRAAACEHLSLSCGQVRPVPRRYATGGFGYNAYGEVIAPPATSDLASSASHQVQPEPPRSRRFRFNDYGEVIEE